MSIKDISKSKIKLRFDHSYSGLLYAVQSDRGRMYEVQILDEDSREMDVTGLGLDLYIGTAKEVVKAEGEIKDAKKGIFTVTFAQSQLLYPGMHKAQFLLHDAEDNRVGSKVFDIRIEESVYGGATAGRNLYVDFEKIDEVIELILNFDTTLEEAKEVDLRLKVDTKVGEEVDDTLRTTIEEAKSTKTTLSDIEKTASETDDRLKATIQKGEEVDQSLKTGTTKAEEVSASLVENRGLAESVDDILKSTIDTAQSTDTALKGTTERAQATDEALKSTDGEAKATKSSLDESVKTASEADSTLKDTTEKADTLDKSLGDKVSQGQEIDTRLKKTSEEATATDGTLKETIAKASATDTSLKATDEEAKATEEALREIILSGNLDEYVKEPQLREALEEIDVSGQLIDYLKKDDATTLLDKKVDKEDDKVLSTNDYTKEDKAKVDAIPINPKYTDTTYTEATTSKSGLMSSVDKAKVDGIEAGAEKNKVSSVQGKTGDVAITKADLGLGNVENIKLVTLSESEYNALSQAEKDRTDVWYGVY